MRGLSMVLLVVACGSPSGAVDAPVGGPDTSFDAPLHPGTRTVFVIPMENKPASGIYANTTYAPYINGLMQTHAYATAFMDELPTQDSEPHYIWMEAGTNVFPDATFATDYNPSPSNSTGSLLHLSAQLDTAGIPWMTYQEDITTGACPIGGTGEYAPKHDPFVFFQDVSGKPPSASNAKCGAHHKAYSAFAGDLANGMTGFVFVTPNLCHDMHGDTGCPSGTATNANITAGDTWLSTELPRMITFTQSHDALIFLTWDEGNSTNVIPFILIGAGTKPGATATVYSHSSMLKSTEEFLGIPVLASVSSATDFAAMFESGMFP